MNGSMLCVAAGSLLLAGCAGAGAMGARPAGPPQPDVAAAEVQATSPRNAVQAIFDWKLQDGNARFSGRGVLRMQPPYQARIDLFGPSGETYFSAAVVGDDLRVPPSLHADWVPPVPLLWSVMGVLRPPPASRLTATRGDSASSALSYAGPAGSWVFAFQGRRLVSAALDAQGGGRHTVQLQPDSTGWLPARVQYRDWLAYRELELTLRQVKDVPAFPAETFQPGD
jgi:outer membrane lipoprotein-sorting protein